MSKTNTLPAPAESNETNQPIQQQWNRTALDRCDRCGAQAYIKAEKADLVPLMFCGHHGNKRTTEGISVVEFLKKRDFVITDQTADLYKSTKPDGGSAAG